MSLVQHVEVFRVPCSGPGDLRSAQALIDTGALVPADIVAVTERNTGGKESTPMIAKSAMSVVST